jgi:hypothetical protein
MRNERLCIANATDFIKIIKNSIYYVTVDNIIVYDIMVPAKF